jgi:hypothetical protein
VHRDTNPNDPHDAFWIFALWRAIHGGDSTLIEVAFAAIANLAPFLPAHEDSFALATASSSPYLRGAADFDAFESEHADAIDTLPDPLSARRTLGLLCCDPREFSIDHYYFNFKGVFFRLDRPAFACLPAAA